MESLIWKLSKKLFKKKYFSIQFYISSIIIENIMIYDFYMTKLLTNFFTLLTVDYMFEVFKILSNTVTVNYFSKV